jgi:hypothetical protein
MTANIVIFFDSDWNPQNDRQAMDRAHRIGQTKQVIVYRLIAQDTVDERIIQRAEIKKRLDSVVIQQGRLVEQSKTLEKDEMIAMIKEGASKIFAGNMEDDDMEIDINKILADAEEKSKLAAKEFDKTGDSITKKFSLDENYSFSVYDYQGENWKAEQDRKRIERERIIELPKRERKQAIYNLTILFNEKQNNRPKIKSKIISKPKISKPKISKPKISKPEIQIKKTPPKDELKKALVAKIASCITPKYQLRVSTHLIEAYKLNKSKNSEKENRFLLLKLDEFGMDTENVYDKIKQSIQDLSNQKIRSNSIHGFGSSNHDVFRSLSVEELENRCIRLLTAMHHELYGAGQQKPTAPEKSPVPKKRKILAETNFKNSINETKYKSSEIVISSDSE